MRGRAVLVTGGNGGIGEAIAAACGHAGSRLIIWGRDAAKNEGALRRLRAQGLTVDAFTCDATDPNAVEEAFDRSIDTAGGRIHTVFANAGTIGRGVPYVELELEEWQRVLRTNLDGTFLTSQVAARHMIGAGGGSIVVVSSTSALHGAAGNEAYGTSKTAILGLMRALAVGLARHRIRVNALVPGWTRTQMSEAGYRSDRFRETITARTPLRRWAEPAEMGRAALFLANPDDVFHTGDTIVVDGGYTVF